MHLFLELSKVSSQLILLLMPHPFTLNTPKNAQNMD
jgi:hypothetical protein